MDLHTDYMPSNPGTDYPTKDAALLRLLGDILEPTALFGWDRLNSSGLDWAFFGGNMAVDGAMTTIAASDVTLTNNQTNYIERTHAGVVSANTTGFSADKVPVATAVTNAGVITVVTDKRPLNLPAFGRLAKSVAGGAGTTVLTADEARAPIIEFTGALTGDRVIEFPNVKRTWLVLNNTSGAYTLTAKVNGQTGVEIIQLGHALIYGNGIDIASATGEYRRTLVFTSNGTWTKPAGLKRVRVTVVAGGGAGGGVPATGGSQASSSGGGGGGGASIKTVAAASLGATETVTVGAGGTASTSSPGNSGGTSSFGSHCSCTGGSGGVGSGPSIFGVASGGAGGAGSGGDINVVGGGGTFGAHYFGQWNAGGAGGGAILGGGYQSPTNGSFAGGGGGSYGGAGSGGSNDQSQAARNGGAGASGVVIVEEFF